MNKDSAQKSILWITRTAILIALLIVLQVITKGFGQYVTGSAVNLILIVSVLVGGLSCGITVAVLSPLFAFLIGIGPAFIQIVPFMMVGNLVLVLIWHLISGGVDTFNMKGYVTYAAALLAAALAKFSVFYFGLVKLLLPVLVDSAIVKAPQAAVITTAFSLPQLITASIGGGLALIIAPLLKKAVRR